VTYITERYPTDPVSRFCRSWEMRSSPARWAAPLSKLVGKQVSPPGGGHVSSFVEMLARMLDRNCRSKSLTTDSESFPCDFHESSPARLEITMKIPLTPGPETTMKRSIASAALGASSFCSPAARQSGFSIRAIWIDRSRRQLL
jgi:hypothetical protein